MDSNYYNRTLRCPICGSPQCHNGNCNGYPPGSRENSSIYKTPIIDYKNMSGKIRSPLCTCPESWRLFNDKHMDSCPLSD